MKDSPYSVQAMCEMAKAHGLTQFTGELVYYLDKSHVLHMGNTATHKTTCIPSDELSSDTIAKAAKKLNISDAEVNSMVGNLDIKMAIASCRKDD